MRSTLINSIPIQCFWRGFYFFFTTKIEILMFLTPFINQTRFIFAILSTEKCKNEVAVTLILPKNWNYFDRLQSQIKMLIFIDLNKSSFYVNSLSVLKATRLHLKLFLSIVHLTLYLLIRLIITLLINKEFSPISIVNL
jgi:hypothetical protein